MNELVYVYLIAFGIYRHDQREDAVGSVALQVDGKIVVASFSNGASYVALARHMP